MNLNLRINNYHIALNQDLNEVDLKMHNFKKIGFLGRLYIKPGKNEIVWWSKNCGLKYLNDDFQNSIYPIVDVKAGAEIMYGTSAYLWHKENKLIKLTFQIIENKMAAEINLKQFEEKLIELIGIPTSSEWPFIVWEIKNQNFILVLEYPHRMHGYIHLMNKKL